MRVVVVEHGIHEELHPFAPGSELPPGGPQMPEQPRQHHTDCLGEQRLLVVEVVVDQRAVDLRVPADHADAGVQAPGGKYAHRGVEYTLFLFRIGPAHACLPNPNLSC